MYTQTTRCLRKEPIRHKRSAKYTLVSQCLESVHIQQTNMDSYFVDIRHLDQLELSEKLDKIVKTAGVKRITEDINANNLLRKKKYLVKNRNCAAMALVRDMDDIIVFPTRIRKGGQINLSDGTDFIVGFLFDDNKRKFTMTVRNWATQSATVYTRGNKLCLINPILTFMLYDSICPIILDRDCDVLCAYVCEKVMDPIRNQKCFVQIDYGFSMTYFDNTVWLKTHVRSLKDIVQNAIGPATPVNRLLMQRPVNDLRQIYRRHSHTFLTNVHTTF